VFDYRESVFDPSGKFVRSSVLFSAGSPVTGAAVFRNGDVVIQSMVASRDLAGIPLHVMSPAGQLLASFGELNSEPYVESFASLRRRIAASGDTAVWASRLNRYRLELWSRVGVLEQILDRKTGWFSAWDPAPPLVDPRKARRPPMVRSVSVDVVGRVWVVTTVADRHWMPSGLPGSVPISPTEWSGLADSMIEVIDPRTERLIHAERFDAPFEDFVAPSILSELVEDSQGVVSIRIWSIELHPASRKEIR
jgi:hypothetical protein